MADPAASVPQRFTSAGMQTILDRAAAAVEDPTAALFVQDTADADWWEVSLDDGTTWHFFTGRSASAEISSIGSRRS